MDTCVNKCELETNELVVRTVIEKGFSNDPLDNPFGVNCSCGESFKMDTFLKVCPKCESVYAITPCHQSEHDYLAKVDKEVGKKLIK